MISNWINLILVCTISFFLSHCGSEEGDVHPTPKPTSREEEARETKEPSKPAAGEAKGPELSTNKPQVPVAKPTGDGNPTATVNKPAISSSSEGSGSQTEKPQVDASEQEVRPIDSEKFDAKWELKAYDHKNVKWHFIVNSINYYAARITIKRDLTVYTEQRLGRTPRLEIPASLNKSHVFHYSEVVKGYASDWHFSFYRNNQNGECEGKFFIDGTFSDTTLIFQGKCL